MNKVSLEIRPTKIKNIKFKKIYLWRQKILPKILHLFIRLLIRRQKIVRIFREFYGHFLLFANNLGCKGCDLEDADF